MHFMSVKPRTIDNLGMDASVRYAQDQQELTESTLFTKDFKVVPQKSEISFIRPYTPSAFDQLFAPTRAPTWARFEPPPAFFAARSLFTFQLIPSLGGYEKQDADLDKLEALGDALEKEGKGDQEKEGKGDQEKEENKKKRRALLIFLQCVQKLDRALGLINSRRNQYQRG